MPASIRVEGDKAVRRKLEALPRAVQKRVVKRAMFHAGAILTREFKAKIRSRVHKVTGRLRRSVIRVQQTLNGTFVVVIGPSYAGAPHQHLVEYGTVKRFRARAGADKGERLTRRKEAERYRLTGRTTKDADSGLRPTGVMPALPYGEPVFAAKGSQALDIAMDGILDGVMKELGV